MERQWRQPVVCSRSSTVRSIGAALDGASRWCQYAYLQLNATDDVRPRSMTDRYFTGARRRKFWTFQNFRTTTAAIGAQWRLATFTHGRVCALWRSTAFIHGFWTAAERRQKPPMCNSGLSHPGLGWLYVFNSFPLRPPPPPRPPPQQLLPLTSKPFELNLTYLAQRIYGSGEMSWMTFSWPWPKVTAVAKICLSVR